MRAFLSHRSSDKPFVQKVAEALGRSRAVYDVFEFSTGDDFHRAIQEGLSRAGLFVLFASKNSLSARHAPDIDWVRIEIDSAQEKISQGKLSKAVCYIIDEDVTIDDVPTWLTKDLVTTQLNPKLVALDIRRLLNEELGGRRPHFYVGRAKETEEALDLISEDVRPLIVYGLPGIGRRSFVRQVGRNHLSYDKSLEVELLPGDELPELLLKLKSQLGLVELGQVNAFLAAVADQDASSQIKAVAETLRDICESGTLPVVVEAGAITDDNGRLLQPYQALFDAIAVEPLIDLAIVAVRRPRDVNGQAVKSTRVRDLDGSSVQRLLRLHANQHRLDLDKAQLETLATYVAGYPPAAAFAIEEIRTYGVDHVLRNQRIVVNFNRNVFIKSLSENAVITTLMKDILQILSAYSPLPQAVIAGYLDKRSDIEIDEAITSLVDLSLVAPDGLHFAISPPIRDSAYRLFGGLYLDHRRIADLIEEFLRVSGEDEGRLAISQSLFRAIQLSGGGGSKFAAGLASDLITITTQAYYDESYEIVIQYGDQAIQARPNNVDVRRVVAQALVRYERWQDAETHISHMMELGALKEAFYVRGFLEKRRKNHAEAILAYRRAIEYGRGGVAVHRDLAQCYYQQGDLDNAKVQLRLAESASPHNRFVVDLKCTIAMKEGDRREVARCLELLEKIDTGGFAYHRRSRFELSEGHTEEALRYAKLAFDNAFRPSYEISANLANCYIECGKIDEAGSALRALDQKFANTHADARLGLHCKLEIKRGDPTAAQAFWDRIAEKDAPVHLALRAAILHQKQAAGTISAQEAEELAFIKAKLDFAHDGDLDFLDE